MKARKKPTWSAEQVLAGIKKHVTSIERGDGTEGEWFVHGRPGWQSEEYESLEDAVRDLCEEMEEQDALDAAQLEKDERETLARLKKKYEA